MFSKRHAREYGVRKQGGEYRKENGVADLIRASLKCVYRLHIHFENEWLETKDGKTTQFSKGYGDDGQCPCKFKLNTLSG